MPPKGGRKNFSSIFHSLNRDTLPQDELDSTSPEEDTADETSSFNDQSVTIGLIVFFAICSGFLIFYIAVKVLENRQKEQQLKRKNTISENLFDSVFNDNVFNTETSDTTRRRRVPSREEPYLSLTDETKFEEVVVRPHYSSYGQEGPSLSSSGLLTREQDSESFSSGEVFQLQQQQQQQQQRQKGHGERIVVSADVHNTDNSQVGSVRPVIPLAQQTDHLPLSSSTTSLPSYLSASADRGAAYYYSSSQSLPSSSTHGTQLQRSGSVPGISSRLRQAGGQQPERDSSNRGREVSLLMNEEDVSALEQELSPWKPI